MYFKSRNINILSCKLNVNPMIKAVIKQCLKFDSNSRPSIQHLLRDPMFRLADKVSSTILNFKRVSLSQCKKPNFLNNPLNRQILNLKKAHEQKLVKEHKKSKTKDEFFNLNDKSFRVLNKTKVYKSPEIYKVQKKPLMSPSNIYNEARPKRPLKYVQRGIMKSVDLQPRHRRSYYNRTERLKIIRSPSPIKNVSFVS